MVSEENTVSEELPPNGPKGDGVTTRYVQASELRAWREDTRNLTAEVKGLRETLEASRDAGWRTSWWVVVIVAMLVAIGVGVAIQDNASNARQLRKQVYLSCVLSSGELHAALERALPDAPKSAALNCSQLLDS